MIDLNGIAHIQLEVRDVELGAGRGLSGTRIEANVIPGCSNSLRDQDRLLPPPAM